MRKMITNFPDWFVRLTENRKIKVAEQSLIGCDSLPFIWMLFKTSCSKLKFGTDKLSFI